MKGPDQMPTRKRNPELKFEVVQGEEMTLEDMEAVAKIVARWIFRDIQNRGTDFSDRQTKPKPVDSAGS